MKNLEDTKQDINEYIERYVDLHSSKENLVNENKELQMFYVKKAIDLLGLDYVITMLNGEIFEKYKSSDREIIHSMTGLANLIYKNTNLKDLL